MSAAGSNAPIALLDIFRVLWARRWLILVIVGVGVAGGLLVSIVSPKLYKASASIVVREGEGSGEGLLGQLGGLAALGGIAMPGASNVNESLAWLKSRQFGERFIVENELMPLMFPAQWNGKTQKWRSDLSEGQTPTLEDGWRRFNRKVRTISQDRRAGTITIDIVWPDSKLAAVLANRMVESVNSELRQRSIREADASLEQLNNESKRNAPVELQQAIYRMMEAQIKRKVLANSRPDFAFAFIDPAVPSDAKHPYFPNRIIILSVSFLGALMLALVTVFVLEQFRPSFPK